MKGRPAIALFVLWWLISTPAVAQEPRPLSHLFHQAWGIRQGAPGSIVDIAQTTDGYLWLASPGGLYRFDGVRFERYAPRSGTLPRRIVRLLADPRGGLWIGSSESSAGYIANDALRLTELGSAGTLWDLAIAADGATWAATTIGLLRFNGSGWVHAQGDWNLPSGPVQGVAAARDGSLWATTNGGLARLAPGATRFDIVVPGPRIERPFAMGIAEAPDGTIWTSSRDGVRAVARADGRTVQSSIALQTSGRLRFDRRGRLWMPTTGGVARATSPGGLDTGTPPALERFAAAQGLSTDSAFCVLEDREGNIWVGTGAGLDFFRETALVSAPLPPGTHAIRVVPDERGGVWVGSQNRPLMVLRDGVATTTSVPPPVTSVTHDHQGRTWAWGNGRLWRLDADGTIAPIAPPSGLAGRDAWSLTAEPNGRLWVTLLRAGIHHYDGKAWSSPTVTHLPSDATVRLTFSDASGRTWISQDDRVTMVDAGGSRTFAPADGLMTGRISAIASGREHTWFGGDNGLARFDGASVRTVPGIDIHSVGRITGIVEANDGSLWLNADRGVVRIDMEEIGEALAERSGAPAFRVFDYLDGVIGGAAPIPPQSAGKSSDGKLWFVGFDNLVSVDPAAVPTNVVPPPVHIQSIGSGSTTYALAPDLRLAARTSNIQIKYTALSLAMPERVRFRYRLEGTDQDWQDAGTRREAFYTNLAPGHYRFRVIASNNDGVWNETGATQGFVIPPALYQTSIFKGSIIVLALGGVWLLYLAQVRRLRAQMHERIEERLNERERIARELHDTLLQGFQGLILRFQAVATRIPSADPTHALMEEALTRADSVLVEGRDRVRGLRGAAGSLDHLPGALAQVGEELARGTGATLTLTVEGDDRPVHPIVRDEAYWIGREALINAFQHGHGHRIQVEIAFGTRDLRIRVQDDGRGLDEDVLKSGQRPQHWGLPGMRERAARIGASLELRSRQGAGTSVELRVPAHLAYREDITTSRGWWRWPRTISGRLDDGE